MEWNIIPQVFYDFIARILPGSIILIMGYLTIQGPQTAITQFFALINTKQTSIFSFGMFVLGFVFSYFIGFSLNLIQKT